MTTARNRAIDQLRRDRMLAEKTQQLAAQPAPEERMKSPADPRAARPDLHLLELLWRLGREGEARHAYGRALELVPAGAERRFLARRFAEL